ncbi:uncharacterized protein LOC116655269 isoform X2 [Drosophila ananassae]|uniref:uncharacterized protein LOC116655269 isoform X2 n=1 Tax=Drosophila ananassae TaxID=7217 RepID=UPI001CFFEB03|nr:uncharacterized protein LOC116655269 isoform X2 [Drosophila ananassae]
MHLSFTPKDILPPAHHLYPIYPASWQDDEKLCFKRKATGWLPSPFDIWPTADSRGATHTAQPPNHPTTPSPNHVAIQPPPIWPAGLYTLGMAWPSCVNDLQTTTTTARTRVCTSHYKKI